MRTYYYNSRRRLSKREADSLEAAMREQKLDQQFEAMTLEEKVNFLYRKTKVLERNNPGIYTLNLSDLN